MWSIFKMTQINNININEIANHPLQTRQWGEFRKEWGNEVMFTKYGLLTLHKIPFLPFKLGMFIRGNSPTKEMLAFLKNIAKEKNIIFIKLEPLFAKEISKDNSFDSLIALLKENGSIAGKTLFTPTSFWIDLTKSEEDLLKSFSSKTRYNIRLAKRKGVVVVEDNSDKTFNKYLQLTKETVERQGFFAHSEKYHKLMWKFLHTNMVKKGKEPTARLISATYKNETITTWIVFVWKDFIYYPYGASSVKHKNVMANNLMMWETIKLGKKLNLKTFDLWGREPGKGFTKFKEGFNPKVVKFLGTWDLVINKPIYYVYRVAEMIRWPILRLKGKLTKPTF